MSRIHYWQHLINEEGQPIENAEISIYLAGTDTEVTVYNDEFGGDISNTAPQVTTNSSGYFEFWVGDTAETYGYDLSQKFKIQWYKAGVSLGYIDWIDIFPAIQQVDETNSSSTTKNKSVSNSLAYTWTRHANYNITLPSNPFPIHGINQVDETDGDTGGSFTSEQQRKNKVISNELGYKWERHANASFSNSTSANDLYNTYPHGLGQVDITSNDETFDKLVSNKVLKDFDDKWDDHLTGSDDHTQYVLASGARGFSGTVTGVSPVSGSHLATKSYVDAVGASAKHIIVNTYWTYNAISGYYYYDLVHSLNEEYPMIQMWNSDTKKVETPLEFESIDSNTTRIKVETTLNLIIKISR